MIIPMLRIALRVRLRASPNWEIVCDLPAACRLRIDTKLPRCSHFLVSLPEKFKR